MRLIRMLAWKLWGYYVFLSKGARMLRKNLVWVLVRVGELGPIMRIRLDLREVSLQAEAICLFLSLNQLLNHCPDVMWLGGNFWGSGSGILDKIFIVCASDTHEYWWVWVGVGDLCWHPYHWCWISPSEVLMSGTKYEENEAREIRRQIEQFEVTILYDVTWNDHITHVISKAFAST